MSETTSPDLTEWRERIGERVMHAMTCLHADEDFGEGAVCKVCFHNTQRIGALIEADRAALTARLAEAEGALARVPSCVWHGHGGYPESCWWCALNLAALVSPAEPGEGGEA